MSKDRAHRKSSQWPKLEKHVQIKKVTLDFNPKYIINILDSILRYRYRNRYRYLYTYIGMAWKKNRPTEKNST